MLFFVTWHASSIEVPSQIVKKDVRIRSIIAFNNFLYGIFGYDKVMIICTFQILK